MSSIYAELARLKLNTEQKSALIYYLTENGEAEAKAEKAFTACNNDEEKYAYLNLVLGGLSEKSRSTEIESVNLVTDDKISEPHLETEFVEKLKIDTFEEPVFGKYDPKDADLEKFAQKLHLDQLQKHRPPLTDKDIEKFYEFAGPYFTWPSTMKTSERRLIIDYIAGKLDHSKGSHVLIIDGKLVRYGSELSGEEYRKLAPGALYGPIVREVVGAKFSSIEDGTKQEWQVHMRIRNKANPNISATMANIERDNRNRNFRLVLDTGASYTVIPPLLRSRLPKRLGWSRLNSDATGYGGGNTMKKMY
ncbi:4167_t:CDS:2 [Ambispora gerdemannii]|uniref:4167_t:CDS:1 n=1 Tax=Ambispora gerdemannii TaxID=144530 RepID=A0A9N9AKQ5_9GLOM|nr:4167_t:CDS:2 [Ambispora gerdemannii]